VPPAPAQRREIARAIAAQALDVREELGVRGPAVEERDLVPGRQRRIDGVASEIPRSSEDQELHAPQPLSRLISSTYTVSLRRNTLTMMASPTATSAAATVMTKNTNTWPSSDPIERAKATNA